MYITRYIFNIFFILPYTLHVTLHFYKVISMLLYLNREMFGHVHYRLHFYHLFYIALYLTRYVTFLLSYFNVTFTESDLEDGFGTYIIINSQCLTTL